MAHRLLILGCQTMREGVVASFVFFVAGVLLFLATTHVVPDIGFLRPAVLFFAAVSLLLAPVILISTFLLSVLPGARERFGRCDH